MQDKSLHIHIWETVTNQVLQADFIAVSRGVQHHVQTLTVEYGAYGGETEDVEVWKERVGAQELVLRVYIVAD